MKQYFNPVISFLFLLFFTGITSVEAQNISINADGSAPDNSAMLDISSSTRGLLVPRMTFLERTLILNPANSLLIYQTDNTPGYYYNSGTATLPVWVQLGAPDNLGNHIATTNIQLGTNYLSGDGDSEGIYIDNTGNIGVGTATPSGKIDIVDNTEEFSINITNSTSSATDKKGVFSIVTGGGIGDSYGIYGEANAASGDKFGVFGGATGAGGIKYGLYGDATGAGTNWAGYFNDGNVYIDNLLGIGTTPSNALSVAGNIDVTSTNFLTTTIESSNIDGAWLALGNTSTGGKYYQLVSTGSNNAQGAGKLLLGYGAAANGVDGLAMTLADNRVGIGTSAPDSSLTVIGGVKATYFTLTDGAASGSVLTSDANGVATWQAASSGVFEKVGGVIRDTTSTYNSDFVIGSPQLDDDGDATHDSRMFFDKSKGAMRAGSADGLQWNDDSIGVRSVAFGENNVALGINSTVSGGRDNGSRGDRSTTGGGIANNSNGFTSTIGGGSSNLITSLGGVAVIAGGSNNVASSTRVTISGGSFNVASGINSTISGGYFHSASGPASFIGGGESNTAQAFYSSILGGRNNISQSYGEVVLGFYNDTLTSGFTTNSIVASERLLVIGNGTAANARSNALVILKNGNTTLNGELTLSDGSNPFTLPNADGTAGQTLQTDGSGVVTWEDAASGFGSGTLGQLTYFTADDSLRSSNELFWDEASDQLRIGVTSEDAKLTVTGADTTTVFLRNNLSGFSTGTAAAMDIALSGANRFNYGLNLNVSGATFQAKGIRADVTGTSSTSVFGVEITTDQTGTGSSFGGLMLSTAQDGAAIGLRARGNSTNSNSFGIDALANGTGGINYGVYGVSNGAATNNYGVHGVAINATGNNYGVYGNANGGTGVNYAGYFNIGNVFIRDTLILNETFRISNGGAVGNVLVSDANGNASWQAPSGSSDLSAVLAAGSDAGNDSILNLSTLTIGSSRAPVTSVEIDSMLTFSGAINGLSLFGSNIYESAGNVRYLNDGFGDAYLSDVSGISGIFHWPSGTAGSLIPGDPASFVRLEDSAVIINGDPQNFEIRLKGIVEVDSIRVNGLYSLPNNAPALGEILQYDGTNVNWAALSGDNLGNHTATTNVQLGTNYLSGDGDNEGIYIENDGDVGIGTITPSGKLDVFGDGSLLGGLRVSGTTAATVGASIYIDGANQDWTIYGSNNSASSGANKLVFRDYTNAADRMAIDNLGNVGIGTTNPNALLQLNTTGSSENLRLTSTSTGTSTSDGFSITNNGTSRIAMRQHENANWQFLTHTGATALTIAPTANIGIGTSTLNNLASLEISGTGIYGAGIELGNGGSRVALTNSNGNAFQIIKVDGATTTHLTINNASGNVGLGTTNPTSRLEVIGDVEIPAANDYTYSTAKTHYQSYAPTAFNSLLPDQYDFGTFIASAYYGYFRSGGTAFGYATVSVNLPDGARVTELEGWIYDNLSTNPVRVSLQRQALGSSAVAAMARVESSALNTSLLVQNITDNTISNAVIDNQNYAYFLFFTGRQNSADTRLYGTRITYTVTEAD